MDICRTCRRELLKDGSDLFDPAVQSGTDLLRASTALKISQDDGLPRHICLECFAQLTSFQSFCQQTINSDRVLRKQLNNKLNASLHVKVELCAEASAAPAATANEIREDVNIKSEISNGKRDAAAGNSDAEDSKYHYLDEVEPCERVTANETNSNLRSGRQKTTAPISSATQLSPRKRPYAPRPGRQIADKSVQYTCDICGKKYFEKIRLSGHLRQHCGLRPFPCEHCPDRQYDKYSKLLVHMKRRHAPPEPDQPTPCPHEGCGKTYRLPRFAQDHYERIHLGMRPKVRAECICDTCGKSFMTRSDLRQHIKWHTDIEQYPYKCDVCDKRFLAKNGYTLHMMRHNNIRNFPCPQCPKRMVSQLELNYHVAKHAKDVPWSCSICGREFQWKGSLHLHERTVHGMFKGRPKIQR